MLQISTVATADGADFVGPPVKSLPVTPGVGLGVIAKAERR